MAGTGQVFNALKQPNGQSAAPQAGEAKTPAPTAAAAAPVAPAPKKLTYKDITAEGLYIQHDEKGNPTGFKHTFDDSNSSPPNSIAINVSNYFNEFLSATSHDMITAFVKSFLNDNVEICVLKGAEKLITEYVDHLNKKFGLTNIDESEKITLFKQAVINACLDEINKSVSNYLNKFLNVTSHDKINTFVMKYFISSILNGDLEICALETARKLIIEYVDYLNKKGELKNIREPDKIKLFKQIVIAACSLGEASHSDQPLIFSDYVTLLAKAERFTVKECRAVQGKLALFMAGWRSGETNKYSKWIQDKGQFTYKAAEQTEEITGYVPGPDPDDAVTDIPSPP